MESKKIMAVILNYNTFEDSVKCAELLKKQTYNNLIIAINTLFVIGRI